MRFMLIAVSFELPVTLTSKSIHIGPAVLLNSGNVEVAVVISLLTSTEDLQTGMQVFPVSHPPFWFPVKHGLNFAWYIDVVNKGVDFGTLEI